ncbi:MAG TPA: hypothetical protein VL096_02125 [Pirellulaceae bacterium]|nr:hypothetical protein [Pirellulaceae bacterium]
MHHFRFSVALGLLAWLLPIAALCAAEEQAPIAGRKVVELDEPFTAFTCGGEGRYFVFHLKKAKKLALLDITAGAIIKTIDVPADDVILTAGLDKLIVSTPSKNLLHRYDLATLKREKSVPTTGPAPIHLLLGAASPGPLVVWARTGPISLLDLETLKPATIQGELLGGDPMYSFQMTISADGQTMCGWTGGISGQVFHVMRLRDGVALQQKTPEGFSDNGRWLRPSYDGSLCFKNGATIYHANMQAVSPDHFRGDVLLPADDPRFFLALSEIPGKKNCQAWISTVGGLEKLINVDDLGQVRNGIIASDHGHVRMQPRVRYVPSLNLVVAIPEGEKHILLIDANLKKMLQARGGEYLYVISNAPGSVLLGQPYRYQLESLSSGNGKVAYTLESGPKGFKLSADGKVTWTPKERTANGVEKVVIVAKAKGDLESFHSFEVVVEQPPVAPDTKEKDTSKDKNKD